MGRSIRWSWRGVGEGFAGDLADRNKLSVRIVETKWSCPNRLQRHPQPARGGFGGEAHLHFLLRHDPPKVAIRFGVVGFFRETPRAALLDLPRLVFGNPLV